MVRRTDNQRAAIQSTKTPLKENSTTIRVAQTRAPDLAHVVGHIGSGAHVRHFHDVLALEIGLGRRVVAWL